MIEYVADAIIFASGVAFGLMIPWARRSLK